MSTTLSPSPTTPRSFATVRDVLTDPAVQRQLAHALPKGMDPGRMLRIALTACEHNPTLKDCEPKSVGMAILRAAAAGLEVDGWDGHLVPFKDKGRLKAQFIADYKGLCKLAYQSELVLEIHAEVVCEGDTFEWEKGTDTFLRWKPTDLERGRMTHVWAGARIRGGGFPFVVLTRADVMRHKAASTAKDSPYSPWNKAETEPAMWRKTALRELCKLLPRSTQLAALLKTETADEIGGDVIDGVLVDSPPDAEQIEQEKPKAERIADELAGRVETPKATDTPPEPAGDEGLVLLLDQYAAQIGEAALGDDPGMALAEIGLHARSNPALTPEAKTKIVEWIRKAEPAPKGSSRPRAKL
jgi:recombination protein RecT